MLFRAKARLCDSPAALIIVSDVAHNLWFRAAHPLSDSFYRDQGMAALAKVGLTEWSHHNPNELSSGQQQRVAIARALVTEPDVLLADEPTGNLDSERSVEIMELLAELNAKAGFTVLLVTHEPEMAAYARKIVHFKDGLVDSVEVRGSVKQTPLNRD